MDSTEKMLRLLASESAEIAVVNGFDPVTWEILPGRIMMIITELDEMVGSAFDQAGKELADVLIRSIGLLHVLFPTWTVRLYTPDSSELGRLRRSTPDDGKPELERELWWSVHHCSVCVKAWQRGDSTRVRRSLELIVYECFRLATMLSIDLMSETERKVEFNRTRPHRHGAVKGL